MNAILFVGHGSQDPEGNEEVRQFVRSLKEQAGTELVETCFLEFEAPDIAEGISRCVAQGATNVAVIPIILFAAGHSKLHIPAAIDEARERYPNVRFRYGRPIGLHEQTVNMLMEGIQATIDGGNSLEETALLVVGRGSSDPDANSDLFKVSRLLSEKLRPFTVETAFIGVTYPLMDDGVERCIRLGAKHVVIVPYFLFTGILIKRMERMLEGYRSANPKQSFDMAPYFGFNPRLKQILVERAQEALNGEVSMNCDLCQYRLEAGKEAGHHHHHHHGHHGHGSSEHGHQHRQQHSHDHHCSHKHDHHHAHGHDGCCGKHGHNKPARVQIIPSHTLTMVKRK
jgi:sirohydrochlorin cobaltochelatase